LSIPNQGAEQWTTTTTPLTTEYRTSTTKYGLVYDAVPPSYNATSGTFVLPPPAGSWGCTRAFFAFQGAINQPIQIYFDTGHVAHLIDFYITHDISFLGNYSLYPQACHPPYDFQNLTVYSYKGLWNVPENREYYFVFINQPNYSHDTATVAFFAYTTAVIGYQTTAFTTITSVVSSTSAILSSSATTTPTTTPPGEPYPIATIIIGIIALILAAPPAYIAIKQLRDKEKKKKKRA
jgi:hypothetical protein